MLQHDILKSPYTIDIAGLGLAQLQHLFWFRVDGGIVFRVSLSMHCEVPMGSSQPDVIGGLALPQETLEHIDPAAFRAQQVDIVMGLRERIQNPPPGEFRMEDLVWADHITHGKGRHKGSRMALILWDRLTNFISGEQHHPLYPCRFNIDVIRRNLPNSLRSPRTHSPAVVVRFDLFLSLPFICTSLTSS